MKYRIDLTDSYRYCIDFDGWSGVECYAFLPIIEKDTATLRMHLENVSINMVEDIYRDQILSVNPLSLI